MQYVWHPCILILLISISFSNLYSSVWPELNLGIGINYIDTKFGGYNPDNISLLIIAE